MRRNILLITSIALLLSSLMAFVPIANATHKNPEPEYDIIDIGPEIRTWKATRERIAGPMPIDLNPAINSAPSEGMSPSSLVAQPVNKFWFGLDSYCGYYYFKEYELRAVGEFCEIWVAHDLGWTTPPVICEEQASDPREVPVVTDEQVAYLLNEFENNIYSIDIEYFGSPDYHDGTNSLLVDWGEVPPGYYDGDKIVILVDNVRDNKWYDDNYPWQIGGFYSPSYEFYFDRNIITIDAYDWENRIGPDAERPYTYEGIIAHELQHLLHSDIDWDEDLWLNEGCADLAAFLCGYGIANKRHTDQLAEHPENSLVLWGDQGDLEALADYGIVYLFALNLYEDFGGPFIKALVANQDNGITSVNSTLDALRHKETFADIYHKFAVSLVTDPGYKKGGAYSFKFADFTVDVNTPEAYDTPGAPPWGTDFIKIENPQEIASLSFNGVDTFSRGTPWIPIYIPLFNEYFLWSGGGDLLDNWLILPLDLTAVSSATLAINHLYNTEQYWDFCFVQVSTDGGHTWTSLADNEGRVTNITDPDSHPKVKANVPGFTGLSEGFVNSTFNLTPYAGQNIHIAFRYVTDWVYFLDGWLINEILVEGDGSPIFHSSGTSTDPFMDITQLVPVDYNFTVTLIGVENKKSKVKYNIVPLELDRATEEGSRANLAKIFSKSDYMVMLVTFDAPEYFTRYADYTYEIVYSGP